MNDNTNHLKYSKLNVIKNNHKSRSLDFSDLSWFPRTPNSITKSLHTVMPTNRTDAKKAVTTTEQESRDIGSSSPREKDQQELADVYRDRDDHHQIRAVGSKAAAAPVLRRNSSLSMSSVKSRVLSMRRSSSVNSEMKYCRIYDQSVALASPMNDIIDEEEDEISGDTARSARKKKKRGGKFLKVCKRFFGLI